jgi:Fic family protein
MLVEIPALRYEEHYWVADNDGMASRAKLAAASGSYKSAIPAAIAELEINLPGELAADTEDAATALAKFDSYAAKTLGIASKALGPMSSILLRTESTSSSQIENLTVGARQLALAEINQSSSDNARVVVGNVRAMEAALVLANRLDENAILEMQKVLVENQRGWELYAGKYREGLVWVGRSSLSPRGASYVAPQAELIRPAMSDLISFIRREDMPIIAQAALAHAQFETIHPFADGNGRTGRAMVHAILRAKGIMQSTTAPVSAGLLRQTEEYFAALGDYRAGDAAPIIARFSEASRFAATSGMNLVDNLASQLEESKEKLSRLSTRSGAWRVLPYLVAQPVINARELIDKLGMNEMAAQRALAAMTDYGVLEERTGKQRNRVWQHSGILSVLDDYAARIRRK